MIRGWHVGSNVLEVWTLSGVLVVVGLVESVEELEESVVLCVPWSDEESVVAVVLSSLVVVAGVSVVSVTLVVVDAPLGSEVSVVLVALSVVLLASAVVVVLSSSLVLSAGVDIP